MVDDQLGHGLASLDEDQSVAASARIPALQHLGVSPSLRAVVQAVLSDSWSQVKTNLLCEQPDATLVARTGTRPGDPIADVTFTAVLENVLRLFVQDVGAVLSATSAGGIGEAISPIVWMDDVAIFIEHTSPVTLIEHVRVAASALFSRCAEQGLTVNCSRGKSEVLFRPAGRGSQQAHQVLAQHGGRLEFGAADSRMLLPLTSAYVHLGQKHTASLSSEVEIDFRLA